MYKNIYLIKNNNGDNMIFVYIENSSFLSKIIYFLQCSGIKYTTDLNSSYSSILIAEVNHKTIKLIEENYDKQIIFITYLDENKILRCFNSNNKRSIEVRNKYSSFFRKCNKLIVSLSYFKNILSEYCYNIDVIPHIMIPFNQGLKNINERYSLNKRKKKVIIIDLYYDNLEYIYNLTNKYPKFEYIYIGYKPSYLLSNKKLELLHKLPSNVIYIPYIDLFVLQDLLKVSYIVVDFNSYKLGIEYMYLIIMMRKYYLLFNNVLYRDLLIPSKNCYCFNELEEFISRFDKIVNGRVMNLSDNNFELIKSFTFEEVIKKYRESLK